MRSVQSEEEIESPIVRYLYSHWHELRGENIAPLASDFDPLNVVEALPFVGHIRVENEGADFYTIFVGQEAAMLLQRDPMGKRATDLPKDHFQERALQALQIVVREKLPVLDGPHVPSRKIPRVLSIETLNLPLLDEAGNVAEILGIMHCS